MNKYAVTLMLVLGVALSATAADTVTFFETTLTEGYVRLDGVQGTGSDAGGVAQFVLTQPDDPSETTLAYFIQFENVDLDGQQTPNDILDDIVALHLHDITECAVRECREGDTAGTRHVLNIFGLPRLDDDDVMVDAENGIIIGTWDDGDASPPNTLIPSLPISEVVDQLFAGEIALFVHTQEFPSAAAGGVLTIVPEPTAGLLAGWIVALLWFRRRAATC